MLINTSFNVRGEPIVCTPEDAYRCFLATDMDALVLEHSCCSRRSSRNRQSIGRSTCHSSRWIEP